MPAPAREDECLSARSAGDRYRRATTGDEWAGRVHIALLDLKAADGARRQMGAILWLGARYAAPEAGMILWVERCDELFPQPLILGFRDYRIGVPRDAISGLGL